MRNLTLNGKGSIEAHLSSVSNRPVDRNVWIDFINEATNEFVDKVTELDRVVTVGDFQPEKLITSLDQAINDFIVKAAQFEKAVDDPALIEEARKTFHNETNHSLSKSYCINRARTWPQGYQGDHRTLETAYRNMPLSDDIGYFLDLNVLNSTLAIAVRNRIRILQDFLKEEMKERKRPDILNIACGSCRELIKIAPEIVESNAHVTCVDHDEDALAFSQSRLYYTGVLNNIDFRKFNALRLFDSEIALNEFGPRDVIYSVGLFDYLESDFLVKMLNTLYKLLKPGGKLIAAFKDAGKYRSQEFHWLCDWDGFLQRKEKDFLNIFSEANIPDSAITQMRDETGAIIFYTMTK